MTEKVYPIIIKMNTKDVQIGSAKVEIEEDCLKGYLTEHDVTLKEIKIQFKKGDFLTKVNSSW